MSCILWNECCAILPEGNGKIIVKALGSDLVISSAEALRVISEIHPEWDSKRYYVQWLPYTDELWKALNKSNLT